MSELVFEIQVGMARLSKILNTLLLILVYTKLSSCNDKILIIA